MANGILFLVLCAVLAVLGVATNTVEQMHLSQGTTPTEMFVMWVTAQDANTDCEITDSTGTIVKVSGAKESYSFATKAYGDYTSGTLHNALFTQLKPNAKYTYKCGDSKAKIWSNDFSFTTLPAAGDPTPVIWGVVGDMGVTPDSLTTMQHTQQSGAQGILHAGDLSYANCNQPIWDSFGQLVEPLAATVPWMVGPGNHEIEWTADMGGVGDSADGLFKSFEARYKMPVVKPAEFGVITMKTNNDCTPSVFQAEYDYGNAFYSFEAGLTHVTYLNCYSTSDTNSAQYKWAEQDFKNIDRSKTPWLVVVQHCPWYNSNTAHVNEAQTVAQKASMESLFYKHGVNVAFQGHVHAYERTYPVYKQKRDEKGTMYINIGDAGNAEGHATTYTDPAPEWSAFRNGTQYGHGTFTVFNSTAAVWEWNRNVDGVKVSADTVHITI